MFEKLRSQKRLTKEKFIEIFFSDQNHYWISSNTNIKRAFIILLNSLSNSHIDFFSKNQTFFIPCQAHLSCAVGKTKNQHLILVFPDLIQLLKSASSMNAVAILAHELGHIYYQHTEFKIDTLQAQFEADYFSHSLGFTYELKNILIDFAADDNDCIKRINRLNHYLNNN